jgi:hypothetical protein
MQVRATVTQEPGLHDLLNQDDPPPDAELMESLDAFLATPGIGGTDVADELDTTIREQADSTAQGFGGWWEALRRWLAGERHEVVGTERGDVELEALWLTLPDVTGASATVSSSVTDSDETSASVTIAGIGGGPTFTIALKEKLEFDGTTNGRIRLTAKGPSRRSRSTRAAASSRPIPGSARWRRTISS